MPGKHDSALLSIRELLYRRCLGLSCDSISSYYLAHLIPFLELGELLHHVVQGGGPRCFEIASVLITLLDLFGKNFLDWVSIISEQDNTYCGTKPTLSTSQHLWITKT